MPVDPIPPSDVAVPVVTPAVPGPSVPAPERQRRTPRPWFTRLLTGRRYDDEIAIYRHSNLFYWWPVWLLGFIFAGASYLGERHMAIVPPGTRAVEDRTVDVSTGAEPMLEKRNVLILPSGAKLAKRVDAEGNAVIAQPTIYIAPHRAIGTIYLFVLLLVIVMTNISLRGLWSLLVLLVVVMLIIMVSLAGWAGHIFRGVGLLSIYINMGGYFLISTVLFVLWALNFFFMDRMTYMIFTPGQVRVRLEVGGGEMVYDAAGMTVQKQRSDFFRHWVLGFGSGDLLVWPANHGHAIDLPNVLRVSVVVREIEQMIKEKVVLNDQDRRA